MPAVGALLQMRVARMRRVRCDDGEVRARSSALGTESWTAIGSFLAVARIRLHGCDVQVMRASAVRANESRHHEVLDRVPANAHDTVDVGGDSAEELVGDDPRRHAALAG